jgi:dihydropteroate synthase
MFPSDKTLVMGILNVTPDSFSDGGRWNSIEAAVSHALQMAEDGADIIDIGGQSTRPGYSKIGPQEELDRLLPILLAFKEHSLPPLSVDTFYPEVAQAAIEHGVHIINDITGFADERMITLAAKTDAGCVVMHSEPSEASPDIIADIKAFFALRLKELINAGVDRASVCLDPGVGFGKTQEQNLLVLKSYADFAEFGCITMAAASRKRVVGIPCGNPPFNERLAGTLAAHTAAQIGGARVIRAHDVKEAVQAARVIDALLS